MKTRSEVRDFATHGADACWNTIGVRGDGSCDELTRVIHCVNCPVYSDAARLVLDRESSTGYISECTEHYARVKEPAEPDTESVLAFRIESEWLAVPTRVVVEIAEVRPIHSLPHRRSGVVQGLTNVRGELLICISLPHLLGVDASRPSNRKNASSAHRRFVVLRLPDVRCVCLVDEVPGTHRYRLQDLKALPTTVAKGSARYTRSVLLLDDRSVGLLDDQRLSSGLRRSFS